ncbi:MAG: hypothetical protein KDA96_00360 [Planctomycetaceae bacterium]|nr:hypothetical protein [Planctomycetaceae bacterium]
MTRGRQGAEMMVRHLMGLVAVVAALAGNTVQAQNADLRWKLQPGDTLHYVVDQNMTTILDVKGNVNTIRSANRLFMTWEVTGRSSSGDDYIVGQSIDRVIMKMEGGPAGLIEFDTASADAPKSPAAQLMSSVFRRIVGQSFVVTMAPSGAIRDVKIPAGLMDAIIETQGGASNQAPLISEDMMKQMMEQAAVTLPGKDTAPGTSWRTSQVVDMPLGRMTVSSLLKLQAVNAQTGSAMIHVTPSVSIVPRDDAPQTLELKDSKGQGTLVFNTTTGRITESTLNLTINMDVTQFGELVKQTTQQVVTMKLQP